LCPVHRQATLAATSHVAALRERLARYDHPLVREPAGRALQLLDGLTHVADEVPVSTRWHGDFTPWNCARTAGGTLWVWDWESSEPDAAAGLDALHWSYSIRRRRVDDLADIMLRDCLEDARHHLVAAGVPRRAWASVAAVYVVTMIERACGLAAENGGWERVWIQPDELVALAAQATALASD
jgi:hypothetical protein